MFNLFQEINYREVGRAVLVATKIIVGFLILICFGGTLVNCNEAIPICEERWKQLVQDTESWRGRCSNESQDYGSPCCEAEKDYFKERFSTHKKMCFLKGPYPVPFLLIRTRTEIMAIDLTTHADTTVVIPGLKHSWALDIDTVDDKIYFQDGTNLYRANYDGSDKEIISKNVNVWDIAIDWIGRRIFWCDGNNVYVMTLDGKERRRLIENLFAARVAIDPTSGSLFWRDSWYDRLYRTQLADKDKKGTLIENVTELYDMTLDYVNKSGYFISYNQKKIYSFDYDGAKESNLFYSSSNRRDFYTLGIFGKSLYFTKGSSPAGMIEMNVFTRNISRYISLPDGEYRNLVVVDESRQPYEPFCGKFLCGPHGYCVKFNGSYSCQCEYGFRWNGFGCEDINECLQFPCNSSSNTSCNNYPGSYTCSECDDGELSYEVFGELKRCFAISELKIRLVNSTNNNTGTVEIFHPVFGWGTVGHWEWDIADGNVVCRQLGFTGASAARRDDYYGGGSGPTLLGGIQCTGFETYIWDCLHVGWNPYPDDTYHDYDAGVDCY